MLTSEMVKKYARDCGADAVGISPMDRFEGAPPELDPRYFYPEAKSIIGMIFRIPRGYIRGIEEGTNFYQYPSLGYAAINEDFAPTVLYEVGRFIENHGYEAAVFRNTGGRGPISDIDGTPGFLSSPEEHTRACRYSRPKKEGFPAPDIIFQFRIAAFLCGLGQIGYSKMFLTPDFGPLNRQVFIFTDAELTPDEIYNKDPLCDKCMACVGACPGKCINPHKQVSIELAGHNVEWGELNEWDCFIYYQGANKKSNPFLPQDAFKELEGGDELKNGRKHITPKEFDAFSNNISKSYPGALYGYNPPKCGGCLRACFNNMEKKGVLNNKFKNQFRSTKPWQMD